MQVVKVRSCHELSIEQWTFEPVMPECGSQRRELGIEEEVQRMAGDDKVDGHHAEVQNVLDRMHGKTGPGPRVRVHMVDPVKCEHQGPPVQESMREVEMSLAPQRGEKENSSEP